VNRYGFYFFLSAVVLIQWSCQPEKNTTESGEASNSGVPLKAILISDSGLSRPVVVPVDENKLIKVPAGNPDIIRANQNIQLAGFPDTIHPYHWVTTIPGKNGYFSPDRKILKAKTITSGPSRVIKAKAMLSKDRNPGNFRILNKLQGLLSQNISCMFEDRAGNLWIGSDQGICRFDGQQFFHYTENEGLSGNTVNCMLEDKKGAIWIGTNEGGLCSFDGSTFSRFSRVEGFFSNSVNAIMEDSRGNLWFGTNDGACRYDGKFFTRYTRTEGLSDNVVFSMKEDRSGNIWFGTLNGGILRFDGKKFHKLSDNTGLAEVSIYSMLVDKNGSVWFGSDREGAICYNGKDLVLYNQAMGMVNNTINSIIQDREGNVWFGTDEGINRLDKGNRITYFSEKEGLSDNAISCILESRSGNLWFGTKDAGICRFFGQQFTHFTEEEGLVNNNVRSIVKDRDGNMWFGTHGGGVCRYDGRYFYRYSAGNGLIENEILCILQDRKGFFWFGTRNGVVRFDGRNFTLFTIREGNIAVVCLMEDKAGRIWFGTIGAGICRYEAGSLTYFTDREQLNEIDVLSMAEDQKGNLWFGTASGLRKFNGKNFYKIEGISSQRIFCIKNDHSGNIWFGTDAGLDKLSGNKFIHYTEKQGLINNGVRSILEDQIGNLWFGTRFGISRLKPGGRQRENDPLDESARDVNLFKNYTYEDGFLGIGCLAGAMCDGPDGNIWIGTNDRLTQMHLSGLREDTIPPTMEINEIRLFNRSINWEDHAYGKSDGQAESSGKLRNISFESLSPWHRLPVNLSLRHDNNSLSFRFSGICTNQPEKIRYEYKLEGLDNEWIRTGSESEANFTTLPPSKYNLLIRARNDDGYWSKVLDYPFEVRPPWWNTGWAYTGFFILFVSGLYSYIRWRERRLVIERIKLEAKIAESTSVILQQKEEVIKQKDLIEDQKKIVETKHRQLSDSIKYAERIQRSFLASSEMLNSSLKDHFIFFHPKDVVSGDFYWASPLMNGDFAVVCADCTGHGVPGAIMSLLLILSMEKTIESRTEPADILNETRRMIISRLEKEMREEHSRDGMDCTFMVFRPAENKVWFAGAQNPLWLVRNGELTEYKADRMPVGRHERDSVLFTQHEIQLHNGDMLYAFSDGMPDQFGGPNDRKFGNSRLKELLISGSELPASEQLVKIKSAFFEWKGSQDQVDDVIVMGIRV
jgi:ligand-binding sensor domain-containing protein/serine phosphatase RsbU (regulator of sigma subunit)